MIITTLQIVDWYDDIITSIISFDNDKFILNCIQKNFVNGEKIYYCVKIDEESFEQIATMIKKNNLTKKDWNILNLIFEKNNKNENFFLLKTELLKVGSDVIFNKANSSDVINIKFLFDISNLYKPDLRSLPTSE